MLSAALAAVVLAVASTAETERTHAGAGHVVLAAEPARASTEVVDGPTLIVAHATATAETGAETGASGTTTLRFAVAKSASSGDADRVIALALTGASTIELRGGTWTEWYRAAHEGRHAREWTRALLAAHATGTEVRATGAAAAWIARWSPVARTALEKPSQDPHDASLELPVEGLGLFDGALVGVMTAGAPSADRVVERAIEYGYEHVLLLAGDAELDWDPVSRTARIRIPAQPATADATGSIAVIDLAAGERSRASVRSARLTLPADGDVLGPRGLQLEASLAAAGDPREDASVSAFVAHFASGAHDARSAGSRPVPSARIVRTSRDDATRRSERGGFSGLVLDLEVGPP